MRKRMIAQRADILFESGKFNKSELCYTAALKIDPMRTFTSLTARETTSQDLDVSMKPSNTTGRPS